MKLKNKLFIILLLILIILNIPITSFADDNINLNLHSKSCILIECSTKQVAYEQNADTVMYPASTTKLLTAIIALEKCELTDTVTITNEMTSPIPSGYTTAYLRNGETLTVEELLNVLLIPSANDAGYALAIHISGSVDNFSILMNEKAKEIGCTNSNFTNPSGIHNENHYSTAKDISLIGLYALKYPEITSICSKTSYTLASNPNNIRTFETTNTLMKTSETNYYEYATGLKTGFTEPAGSCIVATAKKDNMEFLVVVLGAPEPENNINYRDIDCKTLFEYGFNNYDEIIKFSNKFFNIFNNLIFSNAMAINFCRAFVIIITCFSFYVLLKKNSKKNTLKNKKKKTKKFTFLKNHSKTNNFIGSFAETETSAQEFNFRCSFW